MGTGEWEDVWMGGYNPQICAHQKAWPWGALRVTRQPRVLQEVKVEPRTNMCQAPTTCQHRAGSLSP